MDTVNLLDMRTLLIGNVVGTLLSVVVMISLWRQSRDRFPAIVYWLRSFSMQFVGIVLISLRGAIPDLFSILLSGILVSSGFIQLYIGLGHYLDRPTSQRHNYLLQLVFLLIHAYFTFAEPSLYYRNLNYSVFIVLICAQISTLLLVRIPPETRLGTTAVGVIMSLYATLNLGRICFYAAYPPKNDLFYLGPYDAALFLCYQILIIALTFSLVLMVNRRLNAQLEGDLERLRQSDAALRTSQSRLTRAELAAKSGNWELHLDSKVIHASEGAATLYGLNNNQIDYATIKNIPLPEYRPLLDAAMSDLIAQRAPYDVEFKIHTAASGAIKDIHSIATYNPETRIVFGVIQDITERKIIERRLEHLAQVDPLTGLSNRRHFLLLAEQELARTERYGGELSALMIDIDHFKLVNDTYGHQVGDRVLQTIANVFRNTLREVDDIGRVGGEEFAVLFPQTGIMQAFEVAERLRRAVEQTEIPLERGIPLRVTISIGMTSRGKANINIDTLLSRADKALYQAKTEGRNQVCIYEIGETKDEAQLPS